jgi:hypothetical protein
MTSRLVLSVVAGWLLFGGQLPVAAAQEAGPAGAPLLPGSDPLVPLPPPAAVAAPAQIASPPPAVVSAAPPVVAPVAAPAAEAGNPYSEYELCLHYQRAGNSEAARECYQRFLPTALRAGNLPESAIPPLLAQLTRFPAPATVYPTLRREGTRRNSGLWGAGLAMLLSGMVPPLVFGPLYAQQASSNRQPIFYTLMAPVVGPFISGTWLPLVSKSHDDVIQYTIPWVIGDGVTQLVGFIMFVAGLQSRPLPPRLARLLGDVHILPYASGQSAGLHGSF